MAAQTFWQWYDKELPRGDEAVNFEQAYNAGRDSLVQEIQEYFKKEHSGGISERDILTMISK